MTADDATDGAATSLTRSVVVPVPVDRAFALFTGRLGDFKPPEHNLLSVPIAETVFEPRVGGAVFDRGVDGSQCRWARVLAFDAPERVVLSWDIGPTWQIETDPARTSEVEIRFLDEGEGRTRVVLEHRHLDRHGPGWEGIRGGLESGWPTYLSRYADLVASAPGRQ